MTKYKAGEGRYLPAYNGNYIIEHACLHGREVNISEKFGKRTA